MSKRKPDSQFTEEPRYCPECGEVWTPGTSVCRTCGERIEVGAKHKPGEWPKRCCHESGCDSTNLCYFGRATNGRPIALCHRHTHPRLKDFAHRMVDWLVEHPMGTPDEARKFAERFEPSPENRFNRKSTWREREEQRREPRGPMPAGHLATEALEGGIGG